MRFKDAGLEAFWSDPIRCCPLWVPANLRKVLYRKLQMLEAVCCINDLRIPPSNHLEKLKGDRAGAYSIRVNLQWRLCFTWEQGEATEVELCDYHS